MDISTDIFKISCANWERDINCSSQSASGIYSRKEGGVNPCHIHICPPNTLKCPQNCKNTNFKQILQRYSENYTYNFGVTSSNHKIFDDFEFFSCILLKIFFSFGQVLYNSAVFYQIGRHMQFDVHRNQTFLEM